MIFLRLETSKVHVIFVKYYVFSIFINDAHHLAIRILNKVFQLVLFITLSSLSVGIVEKCAPSILFSKITLSIESAMANSELTTASKTCGQ